MEEVKKSEKVEKKIRRRFVRGRRWERKKMLWRSKIGEVEDAVKAENEMRRRYFRVRR